MIKLRHTPIPVTDDKPLVPESEMYPCITRLMTDEEREHWGEAVPRGKSNRYRHWPERKRT